MYGTVEHKPTPFAHAMSSFAAKGEQESLQSPKIYPMANSADASPVSAATTPIVVESRFGQLEVHPEQALHFPYGLLGLPENLHFSLNEVPEGKLPQFKLLQCLNDHALSFVVLPIGVDNPILARKDIEETCTTLNIDLEHVGVVLIASVRRVPGATQVTVNARAPIFLDTEDKAGIQYVFPHGRYDISQAIS